MKHAYRSAHFKASLQTVNNGEEAIAYLQGQGPYSDRNKFPLPTVMLLDLNMAKVNGFRVLSWVRSQPGLKRLSVIVLTASARADDVQQAFELGVNSYLVKPSTMAALIAMICCLRDWLEYNHFPALQPARETDPQPQAGVL
jgi:CheY-like chemotaxis protein